MVCAASWWTVVVVDVGGEIGSSRQYKYLSPYFRVRDFLLLGRGWGGGVDLRVLDVKLDGLGEFMNSSALFCALEVLGFEPLDILCRRSSFIYFFFFFFF